MCIPFKKAILVQLYDGLNAIKIQNILNPKIMKSISLRYLLILLLTLPVITACDDDEGEPALTNTDILTAQTWQGEAVIVAGTDVSQNPDLLASLPDVRSLTLKFDADGTYVANFEVSGVETAQEGEWEFRNNEEVLYLDLLEEYELNIDELTAERLELTTKVMYGTLAVPAEVKFVAE